jgi:hypothetical protein
VTLRYTTTPPHGTVGTSGYLAGQAGEYGDDDTDGRAAVPGKPTDEVFDVDLWLLRKIAAELQAGYQEAKGLAWAILIVMETRGLEIDEDARHRILKTTDPDLLDTWLRHAATGTATTADEIIDIGLPD